MIMLNGLQNKIELLQNCELSYPINISLNKIPAKIAPIANKHEGINIVKGDSCIELKLFSLLLYFP